MAEWLTNCGVAQEQIVPKRLKPLIGQFGRTIKAVRILTLLFQPTGMRWNMFLQHFCMVSTPKNGYSYVLLFDLS